MKTLLLFMISTVLAFTSCGYAQKNASEKQAENMLLEFYTKHFQIWVKTSDTVLSDILYEKLDSLMQKYCTLKLRNEAREAFENVGADVPTNNLVSVDLNENLKVEKDYSAKENEYIVSFIATYTDAPGGTIKKQVILHVTVVKEGESYKIDSVK